MKNLMTKTLKTLAVAGMTMGLALGAQAKDVAVAEKSPDQKTLTFHYMDDAKTNELEGTVYVVPENSAVCEDLPWYVYSDNPITNVVFDASFANYRPKSTAWWFYRSMVLVGITGIQNLNTSSVTNMESMFNCCYVLTELDVSNFDTAKVTKFGLCRLFYNCHALTTLDVSNFDTSSVTSMSSMFDGCSSLTTLDVSGFDTANVTSMSSMFWGCAFTTLDVSGFDTAKVTDMSYMFKRCSKLTTICASDAFKTNSVKSSGNMFGDCTSLVGGNGTKWTSGNPADATYAQIDRAGAPGYFTRGKTAITIADVANATVTEVSTNGVPVAGKSPYTVLVDEAVKVVYTATPGYAFPSGKAEFTTNFTARAHEMTVTLAADQWPVPPPVTVEVSAPAGATAAVYTNDVRVAGNTVLSNSTAYVVYTVSEEGKFFENGEKEVINTLDTTTDPAKDRSAYVPTKTGTPTVMLGVVAQRYPWNGTLDVNYKTPFANGSMIVTFKANGTVIGTADGTGGQVKTASFDLNAAEGGAFANKALKDVKVTATIE